MRLTAMGRRRLRTITYEKKKGSDLAVLVSS